MEIRPVQTAAELDAVRALLEEYWTSFGFTPRFQDCASEVANLPGSYAPPDGRLAAAFFESGAEGCASTPAAGKRSGSTCALRFEAEREKISLSRFYVIAQIEYYRNFIF